jgi:hypothetical protein
MKSVGQFRVALAAVLLVAFALRFGLALRFPNISRADEVFQALEPAHRLFSGWGIVTWEWRDGIRSWIFPGFLAGLMHLAAGLHLGPAGYLKVISAVLSIVSLLPILVAARLGEYHAGRIGALFSALLCAFWPDLVYYGPKTLTEVQAGNLLIVAIGLAELLPRSPEPASTNPASTNKVAIQCAGIGAVLGLVFALRFQLAPVLVLVAVWAARRSLRARWLPLLAAAAIPVAAMGVVDLVAFGSLFQSIWKNLRINLLEGRSLFYGEASPIWYGLFLVRAWGAAVLPLAAAFAVGARRSPLSALAAITVILSHSVIAHKEISFIYAAFPPALITAGIGTAIAVRWLHRTLLATVPIARIAAATACLWLAIIGCTAISGDFPQRWRQGADYIAAFAALRDRPDLCGIGFYDLSLRWGRTAGYSILDRPVPILMLRDPAALEAASGSVNYLLASHDLARYVPGFKTESCSEEFCVMHAERACIPTDRFGINDYLVETGN